MGDQAFRSTRWRLRSAAASACALAVLLSLPSPAPSQTRIRIATFNAEWLVPTHPWNCGSISNPAADSPEELEAKYEGLADAIVRLAPDVVNLVEVTDRASVDRLIAELAARGLAYRSLHRNLSDPATCQDIAVLTMLDPVGEGDDELLHFFSGSSTGEWRESYVFDGETRTTSISKNVVYYFEVGGHRLGVLGLHLISKAGGERAARQREAQARVAQRIIRTQIVDRGFLPIVLGDMNDFDPAVPDADDTSDPDSDALETLRDFDASTTGDELTNVADRIAEQAMRWTHHFDEDDDNTIDSNEHLTMLDHVLVHDDLVPFVRFVFIDHSVPTEASDHRPIVVDLLIH